MTTHSPAEQLRAAGTHLNRAPALVPDVAQAVAALLREIADSLAQDGDLVQGSTAEAALEVAAQLRASGTAAGQLPLFSGDHPRCPACGFLGATTEYRADGVCDHKRGTNRVCLGSPPNPRLHRSCLRCDYEWDEALVPPDAEDPAPADDVSEEEMRLEAAAQERTRCAARNPTASPGDMQSRCTGGHGHAHQHTDGQWRTWPLDAP